MKLFCRWSCIPYLRHIYLAQDSNMVTHKDEAKYCCTEFKEDKQENVISKHYFVPISMKLFCRCGCIPYFMSDLFGIWLCTQTWPHTKKKLHLCFPNWPKKFNMTKYPSAAAVPAELWFILTLQFKYGIVFEYRTIAFDFKFLSGLVHKWLEDKTFLWTHQKVPKWLSFSPNHRYWKHLNGKFQRKKWVFSDIQSAVIPLPCVIET